MTLNKTTCLALVALIALSGCVSREQADARLSRGCAAGVEAFLPEGQKIKEVKQSEYLDSAELGKGFRVVNMAYVESDGWADVDKTASCIFAEQFGFMNASHIASIYLLHVNDIIIGKDGDQIVGSYEDNAKLNEKVDKAMNSL